MRLPWQRRPRAREMRPRATSVYKTHRTRTTASTTLVSCVVLVAAAAQVGSAQAYSAFPGQRTHSPCTTDADCIYDGCGDSPHFQSPAGCYSTPIICNHFPHGNEHVITCLARLFFASCTALELIQDPRHSLLSPSRNKNSAAQVVAAGLLQFSAS